MKSPLTLVKERFGDKAKLVAAVEALAVADLWLDRVSEKGLAHVSNMKLLKLHAALTVAKTQFGSRAKLIESILTLQSRGKDAGLKVRLEGYSLPRLLDEHRVLNRQAKAAAKASASAKPVAAAPKKRLLRSKKSQAKAAATK